jgi:hypothetical protein
MAISSEIEKLEKRWQQTSGLVFAPLAEAYRKAGLHARALELLEQGTRAPRRLRSRAHRACALPRRYR